MKNLIAAGVSAVILSAGAAQAATSTQTFAFNTLGAGQPFIDTISVNQFNPALGTLQKVTIFTEATISGSQAGENEDPSPATITLTTFAEVDLSFVADANFFGFPTTQNKVLADLDYVIQNAFNASADDGVTDFDGPAGETFGDVSQMESAQLNSEDDTPFGANPPITTEAEFLNQFTGLGTVDFTLRTFGNTTAVGSANVSSNFQTFIDGEVTVVYQFDRVPRTDVPVPAALPLLASALGGLIWMRRRAS